jgi:polyisoprenoid-binding protein YceI
MAKKIVIGVVVLAVVVIGGAFFYAKVVEGNAPKKLSLSTESPSTAKSSDSSDSSDTSASVDGTWKATKDSTVGYRVTEDFIGGLTNAEAVGRTHDVTGTLTIAGTTVTGSDFTADMTTVKSDRSQRDGQFQGRIMDTAQFPTATFQFSQPIQLGTVPADGVTITKNATGKLTLHGTTRDVTFDVNARRDGDKISVQGSIPIKFADYGIPNPSNPVVSTRDHGTLEFLLVFDKASSSETAS